MKTMFTMAALGAALALFQLKIGCTEYAIASAAFTLLCTAVALYDMVRN